MEAIDLSLPSRFIDASVANNKSLELDLARTMAKQHNCSLDYELKVLDFDSSALGKSEREAVRSMIERLRK